MKKSLLVLSTGFAMFSMFFGSGNLVFPLMVGQQSGGHYLLASLGILLTGVLVPFLGVFAMMLYKGNSKDFFGLIGSKGTFLFSLGALALMGPFGVLARCLTVAHGAVQMIFPSASLVITSLFLCAVIYFLTVNKNKIIPVLGSILTPVLLFSILMIAFFAFFKTSLPGTSEEVTSFASFKDGFFQGYQTMDLLAAFFFSTFVIAHLQASKEGESSEKSSLKVFFKASFVGAGILSLVYFLLVVLGSMYASDLASIRPQEMFGYVALKTLGPLAAPVMCIAVVLACLTTAVVLASLFGEFLHKEVSKEKIGSKLSLCITLVIGFLVSTLDFSRIMAILGPVLELVYPSLIVLTVVNIAHKFMRFNHTHWPVTATFLAKVVPFIKVFFSKSV